MFMVAPIATLVFQHAAQSPHALRSPFVKLTDGDVGPAETFFHRRHFDKMMDYLDDQKGREGR